MESENIWQMLTESKENKEERARGVLEGYLNEMRELDLKPSAVFIKTEARDIENLDPKLIMRRPFGVFEVESRENPNKKLIYKTEIPSSESKGMDREAAFYRELIPEIKSNMDPGIRDEVVFPELYETHPPSGNPKAILISKFEGKILGTHDTTNADAMEEKDMDRIIEIILAVQKISPEKVKHLAPSLHESNYEKIESSKLAQKKEAIITILGEDVFRKAEALSRESFEFESQQPVRLLSEDVFQTNLIKLPDGRLGSFDWERLHAGKNPADDYGKIVSRLWSVPELQEKMIARILEKNKQIKGFKEMFRFNLFIREGAHLLIHYDKLLKKYEKNPQEFEDKINLLKEAREGKKAMMHMMDDIINESGPWEDAKEGEKKG